MNDCKHANTRKEYRADENTGEVKKIGIYCADCGKWIKWESFVADDEFVLPFGKYAHKKLIDVPKDYLIWLSKNLKGNIRERALRILNES